MALFPFRNRSPKRPNTLEESRCTWARGPAAGVPRGSGSPSAAPTHGRFLPACGAPGQTAPCVVASSQSHNAYVFDAVTIYYPWHPLVGKSLRVFRRRKDRHGEYFICELPDQTLFCLPRWMCSPECTEFSIGKPAIAIEALCELRDLLTSLQKSSPCDKASLASLLSQEERREIPCEVPQLAAESSIVRSCVGKTSSRPTGGTRPRSDRATGERRCPKRRHARIHRRSK